MTIVWKLGALLGLAIAGATGCGWLKSKGIDSGYGAYEMRAVRVPTAQRRCVDRCKTSQNACVDRGARIGEDSLADQNRCLDRTSECYAACPGATAAALSHDGPVGKAIDAVCKKNVRAKSFCLARHGSLAHFVDP